MNYIYTLCEKLAIPKIDHKIKTTLVINVLSSIFGEGTLAIKINQSDHENVGTVWIEPTKC